MGTWLPCITMRKMLRSSAISCCPNPKSLGCARDRTHPDLCYAPATPPRLPCTHKSMSAVIGELRRLPTHPALSGTPPLEGIYFRRGQKEVLSYPKSHRQDRSARRARWVGHLKPLSRSLILVCTQEPPERGFVPAVIAKVVGSPQTSLPKVNPLLGGVARSDGVGLGVYAEHLQFTRIRLRLEEIRRST